jgi:putative spermidine/putrescine transport system permease protein
MNGMKKWQRVKNHLGILPSIIVMSILFWSGILQSFQQIFNYKLLRKVINKGEFLNSLLYTAKLSLCSIILVGIISILGIYILYLLSTEIEIKKLNIIKMFLLSPMYIPYLLGGYMVSTLIGQSGIISTLFYRLGCIHSMNEFPILVNESHGYSIILTYGWKASPFVILMVYSTIIKINNEWLDVAKVYGVNRYHFFKEVVFPIIFPIYLSSLFVVFAHIFASFEVPYLLGITYPRTLSVLAYEKYARNSIANREEVMVINSIIILLTASVALIIYKLNKSMGERVELELEK